ncbi:M23 family peptidase [Sesbania bispinosa]|nr:M23 family peptidase [Sesbania bispinosa]
MTMENDRTQPHKDATKDGGISINMPLQLLNGGDDFPFGYLMVIDMKKGGHKSWRNIRERRKERERTTARRDEDENDADTVAQLDAT